MNNNYDYIVVGGGTAGCVIATLLVERSQARVLLLESGKRNRSLYARMPAAFFKLFDTDLWKYETQPEPHANNRRISVPQGRAVGGSSAVNGMVYVRGQAQDYDDWVQKAGCDGWSYADVLPYFIGMENNESMADAYHGTQGHQWISENRLRHPLSMAFIRAAQELGHRYVADFNGAEQAGVGFFQTFTHNGERASTAVSYLDRVIENPRLDVLTGVSVCRLLLEGNTVVGVEYQDAESTTRQAYASKEVVLSAGAFGSPKLLMLSGIGPREHLQALSIPVQIEHPEVGKNLQDHLQCSLVATIKEPISMLNEDQGLKKLWTGAEWAIARRGVASSNILECGGFFDTDGDGRPDVQIHTLPMIDNFDNHSALGNNRHGISFKICYLRPESRGEVRLSGVAPDAPLQIHGNYLSEQADVDTLVRGLKFGRALCKAPSLAGLIDQVILPAPELLSDADLAEHVRRSANTVYHPVGTCRMGSDARSVVDTRLRVRGLSRLRVADTSIIPLLPSGNTNAVTIMIAERAVSFMLDSEERGTPC